MLETFNSLFTPVNAILIRTTRLALYTNKFYLPRYKRNELQKSLKY